MESSLPLTAGKLQGNVSGRVRQSCRAGRALTLLVGLGRVEERQRPLAARGRLRLRALLAGEQQLRVRRRRLWHRVKDLVKIINKLFFGITPVEQDSCPPAWAARPLRKTGTHNRATFWGQTPQFHIPTLFHPHSSFFAPRMHNASCEEP